MINDEDDDDDDDEDDDDDDDDDDNNDGVAYESQAAFSDANVWLNIQPKGCSHHVNVEYHMFYITPKSNKSSAMKMMITRNYKIDNDNDAAGTATAAAAADDIVVVAAACEDEYEYDDDDDGDDDGDDTYIKVLWGIYWILPKSYVHPCLRSHDLETVQTGRTVFPKIRWITPTTRYDYRIN